MSSVEGGPAVTEEMKQAAVSAFWDARTRDRIWADAVEGAVEAALLADPERARLVEENERLRAINEDLSLALAEAAGTVAMGRVGQIGPRRVYTTQVNVEAVERWRAALSGLPSPSGEDESA